MGKKDKQGPPAQEEEHKGTLICPLKVLTLSVLLPMKDFDYSTVLFQQYLKNSLKDHDFTNYKKGDTVQIIIFGDKHEFSVVNMAAEGEKQPD
jgi:hypothetical protein